MMRTLKKSLCFFLSALLMLSVVSGFAALAEWESTWMPVYASAEGRADGDLYIDFAKLSDGIGAELREKLQTATVEIRFLEDPQEVDLFNRPDTYSVNDFQYEVRVTAQNEEPTVYNSAQCPLMSAVAEYAATWEQLPYAFAEGKHYFDVAAYKADIVAKLVAGGADRTTAQNQVNAAADEVLSRETIYYNEANRHVKAVFVGDDARTVTMYYPLFGAAVYDENIKYVKKTSTAEPEDGATKDDFAINGSGFIAWMMELFQKIMELFKKLFG